MTLKKKILGGFALVTLLLIGIGCFMAFGTYSSGYRAGTIMKVSTKGFVWKTYEGQLNMGGMAGSGGSDVASSVWQFSVDKGNDDVIKAIDEAVDSGGRVKLHYREKFYQFNWRGDTRYFVYEVEKIGQ